MRYQMAAHEAAGAGDESPHPPYRPESGQRINAQTRWRLPHLSHGGIIGP